MFSIYRTEAGSTIEKEGSFVLSANFCFDTLFSSQDPLEYVQSQYVSGTSAELPKGSLLPPMGHQEVWAAGVTYFRSRDARMEESESSGGDRFYDLVYDAERPELFLKPLPNELEVMGIRYVFDLIRVGMFQNLS